MNINWDNQQQRYSDDNYLLTIRTGISVMMSNRLMTLRLRQPDVYAALENEIGRLSEQVALMSSSAGFYPNVPEILYAHTRTASGNLHICLVWGVVLSGAKQGKRRIGDYRFVIVGEDELGDCLDRVFALERTLTA